MKKFAAGLLCFVFTTNVVFANHSELKLWDKHQKNAIHILDIHSNYEAQKDIGNTIRKLIENKKADLIALEGAFAPIDLSLFQIFSDQNLIRKVAGYLLHENEISGPIYSALISGQKMPPIVGVDDAQHYQLNVDAYRRAVAGIDGCKATLVATRKRLDKYKRETLNPKLLAFDQHMEAYQEGRVSMGEYFKTLRKYTRHVNKDSQLFFDALQMESLIDLSLVESEKNRLLSHSKQPVDLSDYPALAFYRRYIRITEKIHLDKVYEEMRRIEKTIYASMIKTPQERHFINESRRLFLIGKLIDFSLTKDEWCEFKHLSIPPSLTPFASFYEEATIRDEKIARNFIKACTTYKAYNPVLVTGGFHLRGINQYLSEANFATVTLIPKISSGGLGKIGQGQSTHLRLFEKEKNIFLAKPPFSIYAKALAYAGIIGLTRIKSNHPGFERFLFSFYGVPVFAQVATNVDGSIQTIRLTKPWIATWVPLMLVPLLMGAQGGSPLWLFVWIGLILLLVSIQQAQSPRWSIGDLIKKKGSFEHAKIVDLIYGNLQAYLVQWGNKSRETIHFNDERYEQADELSTAPLEGEPETDSALNPLNDSPEIEEQGPAPISLNDLFDRLNIDEVDRDLVNIVIDRASSSDLPAVIRKTTFDPNIIRDLLGIDLIRAQKIIDAIKTAYEEATRDLQPEQKISKGMKHLHAALRAQNKPVTISEDAPVKKSRPVSNGSRSKKTNKKKELPEVSLPKDLTPPLISPPIVDEPIKNVGEIELLQQVPLEKQHLAKRVLALIQYMGKVDTLIISRISSSISAGGNEILTPQSAEEGLEALKKAIDYFRRKGITLSRDLSTLFPNPVPRPLPGQPLGMRGSYFDLYLGAIYRQKNHIQSALTPDKVVRRAGFEEEMFHRFFFQEVPMHILMSIFGFGLTDVSPPEITTAPFILLAIKSAIIILYARWFATTAHPEFFVGSEEKPREDVPTYRWWKVKERRTLFLLALSIGLIGTLPHLILLWAGIYGGLSLTWYWYLGILVLTYFALGKFHGRYNVWARANKSVIGMRDRAHSSWLSSFLSNRSFHRWLASFDGVQQFWDQTFDHPIKRVSNIPLWQGYFLNVYQGRLSKSRKRLANGDVITPKSAIGVLNLDRNMIEQAPLMDEPRDYRSVRYQRTVVKDILDLVNNLHSENKNALRTIQYFKLKSHLFDSKVARFLKEDLEEAGFKFEPLPSVWQRWLDRVGVWYLLLKIGFDDGRTGTVYELWVPTQASQVPNYPSMKDLISVLEKRLARADKILEKLTWSQVLPRCLEFQTHLPDGQISSEATWLMNTEIKVVDYRRGTLLHVPSYLGYADELVSSELLSESCRLIVPEEGKIYRWSDGRQAWLLVDGPDEKSASGSGEAHFAFPLPSREHLQMVLDQAIQQFHRLINSNNQKEEAHALFDVLGSQLSSGAKYILRYNMRTFGFKPHRFGMKDLLQGILLFVFDKDPRSFRQDQIVALEELVKVLKTEDEIAWYHTLSTLLNHTLSVYYQKGPALWYFAEISSMIKHVPGISHSILQVSLMATAMHLSAEFVLADLPDVDYLTLPAKYDEASDLGRALHLIQDPTTSHEERKNLRWVIGCLLTGLAPGPKPEGRTEVNYSNGADKETQSYRDVILSCFLTM